jgi:hypothetical protein
MDVSRRIVKRTLRKPRRPGSPETRLCRWGGRPGSPATLVILSLPKDHVVGSGCLLLGWESAAPAFGNPRTEIKQLKCERKGASPAPDKHCC